MTPAATVLARARSLGVVIQPDGPKLRVVAPHELPEGDWDEIVAGLAEAKPEILRILDGDRGSAAWSIPRAQRSGPSADDTTPGIDSTRRSRRWEGRPARPPLPGLPAAFGRSLIAHAVRIGVSLALADGELVATAPAGLADVMWDGLVFGLEEHAPEVAELLRAEAIGPASAVDPAVAITGCEIRSMPREDEESSGSRPDASPCPVGIRPGRHRGDAAGSDAEAVAR